jgi:hypothetical protein
MRGLSCGIASPIDGSLMLRPSRRRLRIESPTVRIGGALVFGEPVSAADALDTLDPRNAGSDARFIVESEQPKCCNQVCGLESVPLL